MISHKICLLVPAHIYTSARHQTALKETDDFGYWFIPGYVENVRKSSEQAPLVEVVSWGYHKNSGTWLDKWEKTKESYSLGVFITDRWGYIDKGVHQAVADLVNLGVPVVLYDFGLDDFVDLCRLTLSRVYEYGNSRAYQRITVSSFSHSTVPGRMS